MLSFILEKSFIVKRFENNYVIGHNMYIIYLYYKMKYLYTIIRFKHLVFFINISISILKSYKINTNSILPTFWVLSELGNY